jgi:hypothetical protein
LVSRKAVIPSFPFTKICYGGIYMRTLILSLSLVSFTLPAFAANPWLYKVRVARATQGKACGEDAKTVYDNLEGRAATLFGWPGPIFFEDGEGCAANLLFTSKDPIEPKIFEDAFAQAGFVASYVVDNRAATYMGYTALVTHQDGSSVYCERKGQLQSFPSWIEGYGQLDGEVSAVLVKSKDAQSDWINQQFSCGDLSIAKTVDVVLDVTNTANCELDGTTIRTCFILRGLQKYEFPLDASVLNFQNKH